MRIPPRRLVHSGATATSAPARRAIARFSFRSRPKYAHQVRPHCGDAKIEFVCDRGADETLPFGRKSVERFGVVTDGPLVTVSRVRAHRLPRPDGPNGSVAQTRDYDARGGAAFVRLVRGRGSPPRSSVGLVPGGDDRVSVRPPSSPLTGLRRSARFARGSTGMLSKISGSTPDPSGSYPSANARRSGSAARRGEHCLTVVDQWHPRSLPLASLGRQEITFPEIGSDLSAATGSAVSYRAYTEPALRGRGLHRLSSRECVNTAFALGAKQIFSGVLETNVPSRRASKAQATGRSRASSASAEWDCAESGSTRSESLTR